MARVKFGARLVRGFINGVTLGFALFLIGYVMGLAINNLAGSTVISPVALGLAGIGIGVGGSLGIEISKEMEEGQ